MTTSITKNLLIIIGAILICVGLWGCSKKPSSGATTKTTTQSSSDEELFPEIDRSSLVTPIGYNDSDTPQSAKTSGSGSGATSTNLQIGNTTRIRAGRYNVEGLIRIKSTTSVSLENFSYDATCKGFDLYLTRSNAPTVNVVPFNLTNRLYNNETFTLTFPSGVTINNVDAVAMTCSDKEEPIFVTQLE